MSLKKGLDVFGEKGRDAVIAELTQLHNRDVLEPIPHESLSTDDRRQALPYLMFLKEKRSGQIKGRGCADGRRQRLYTSKEEASSPTVSIEAVILTSTIDAAEGRDVATVDIPNAFMQAEMDDTVYMRIDGKMAELLAEIDYDAYAPCISRAHNNKPVLYVRLKKALYGTLKGALLFWKKLTKELETIGFTINPYDWCVANQTINGSQCTVVWHVDDLKISHQDPNIVGGIIEQLQQVFGQEAPLSVTRGKIHEYLGMTLDFSTPGAVMISMRDYINSITSELTSRMPGYAPTPAANHLFQVNTTNPELLDEADTTEFHHYVAKLLFLSKRARPDIQTAISFLCTRVQSPDHDDWKKLTRVIQYLRGTNTLPLTLSSNAMPIIKWWVDASHGVHRDLKGHTGGVMTLGAGAIYATSTRQKLNTRSSTESELVGIHDVLPQILWTRYFLEAQGVHIQDNVIFQDNKSAILLGENGRASSSKRTRHMHIRYFFLKDRIDGNEVQLHYCPTAEMIGDFFTKPLQGSLFTRFRDIIMNCTHVTSAPSTVTQPASSSTEHRSVLEPVCSTVLTTVHNVPVHHIKHQSQTNAPSTANQSVAASRETQMGDWITVTPRKRRSVYEYVNQPKPPKTE